MNAYASKRNPMFDAPCIGICIDGSELIAMPPGTIAYPHPECEPHYLARQHNEPNPILVEFRRMILEEWDIGDGLWIYAGSWVDLIDEDPHMSEPTNWGALAGTEQSAIDHARRVLFRLASVRGGRA